MRTMMISIDIPRLPIFAAYPQEVQQSPCWKRREA